MARRRPFRSLTARLPEKARLGCGSPPLVPPSCVVVYHFLGAVVPLCTPYNLVGIVVEIDMGTQLVTHSPTELDTDFPTAFSGSSSRDFQLMQLKTYVNKAPSRWSRR